MILEKGKGRIIVSAILILLIVMQLIGCSKKDNEITREKYEELKQKITLSNGMTVLELEELMMRFVYSVYNPKSREELKAGVDLIKDVVTDSVYNELIEAVKFNAGATASLNDVVVRYSDGKNHSDHMSRIICEFTLNDGDYNQNIILEFVFNEEGKIFKYYVWHSSVERNK